MTTILACPFCGHDYEPMGAINLWNVRAPATPEIIDFSIEEAT